MTTERIRTEQTTEMTAAELERAGLLMAEEGVRISRLAVFVPVDATGQARPVVLRAGAVIGAFAVVHDGTTVLREARVEEHVIVDPAPTTRPC